MSMNDVLGFFTGLALNIATWLAIIFWIIYFAAKRKRWAKIVAIICTVLAPISVLANQLGWV